MGPPNRVTGDAGGASGQLRVVARASRRIDWTRSPIWHGAITERILYAAFILSLFWDGLSLKVIGGLFNVRPSFIVFAIAFPILVYGWIVRHEKVLQAPLLPALVALNGIFFLSPLINPGAPYHLPGLITCTLLLA